GTGTLVGAAENEPDLTFQMVWRLQSRLIGGSAHSLGYTARHSAVIPAGEARCEMGARRSPVCCSRIGMGLNQRFTSFGGNRATIQVPRGRNTAKGSIAKEALPVIEMNQPITRLLINPAMLATEQATAKPAAAAGPRRNVAGKLKKTGTAPITAPDKIE